MRPLTCMGSLTTVLCLCSSIVLKIERPGDCAVFPGRWLYHRSVHSDLVNIHSILHKVRPQHIFVSLPLTISSRTTLSFLSLAFSATSAMFSLADFIVALPLQVVFFGYFLQSVVVPVAPLI